MRKTLSIMAAAGVFSRWVGVTHMRTPARPAMP